MNINILFLIYISSLIDKRIIADPTKTEIVLSIDFIPNCGYKFFLAACDNGINLFDFEKEQVFYQIFKF